MPQRDLQLHLSVQPGLSGSFIQNDYLTDGIDGDHGCGTIMVMKKAMILVMTANEPGKRVSL